MKDLWLLGLSFLLGYFASAARREWMLQASIRRKLRVERQARLNREDSPSAQYRPISRRKT